MPAYMITFLRIQNAEAYHREYLAIAHPILTRHGGVPLVVSEKVSVLGGSFPKGRVVIVEFPSAEHAERFYGDPEYEPLKEVLDKYAEHDSAIVDSG